MEEPRKVEEYRVLVGLPLDLYLKVKHEAVEERTTFKKIVAEALQKHMEQKGGK